MKYFSITELCKSNTADQLGIDNTPTQDVIDNLQTLIEAVLDPLREWYNKPIYINSAYRCKALNEAVKGSKTSDHARGCAADISVYSKKENKKLFNYIKDNLEFDQLICEKNYSWVHVGYRKNNNRKQVLYL